MSPWARIDDGFHSHPKIESTSLAGRGLLVTLVSYAANHLTDGIVPESVVKYHARGRGGRSALDELVRRGLLFQVENGRDYGIHDYLDWNDSRAEVEAQRRQARERQGRFRARGKQTQIAWDGAGEAPRNAVTNAAHSIPPTQSIEEEPPNPPQAGDGDGDLLDRIKAALAERLPEYVHYQWIAPLSLVSHEDDRLSLDAPHHLRGWIRERYLPKLVEVAAELEGRPVEVVVAESDEERSERIRKQAGEQRKDRRAERALRRTEPNEAA